MNRSTPLKLLPLLQNAAYKRGLIFGAIILCALLAFEVFNYSSTAFALKDILGGLAFGPVSWATILAMAFCGIDFAGIARIFTPEKGRDEPAEVWYLFGAWLLAAAFNASLTWWGVSVAIMKHSAEGGVLLGQENMSKMVPVVVAVMVLMIRVLLINTFSIAGERLFSLDESPSARSGFNEQQYRPVPEPIRANGTGFPRTAPKPAAASFSQGRYSDSSHHNVGYSSQGRNQDNQSYYG